MDFDDATAALWARIATDDRVSRVVLVKTNDVEVVLTATIRLPGYPIPKAAHWRGPLEQTVRECSVALENITAWIEMEVARVRDNMTKNLDAWTMPRGAGSLGRHAEVVGIDEPTP